VNVLITGGAGFIGSHLADRLLARADVVLVIDNFTTGRRDNLDPATPGLTIVEGDIAEESLVRDTVASFKPSVIVHAAASYKDPDDWATDARTNVVGSAIVARAAADIGVSRLIYLQTALCYGLHPDEQPITLSHPLRPGSSSYAISKTAGEHYVALSGVEWLSFRLANAYGPRNLSGPLPTFFSRLTRGQRCFVMDTRRDFVYVQDLVDVLVKAIDGRGRSGSYHISSGSDVSIKELFDETVAQLGVHLDEPVEIRPRSTDDAPSILLDPSVTEQDFGWGAATPLTDGIAAAIAYYQAFGVTDTYTHLRLDRGTGGQ
jgi:UDP-glucose 4-epimerase